MPALKAILCLEAAERLHWSRLYSLGRPRSHGCILSPIGDRGSHFECCMGWALTRIHNLSLMLHSCSQEWSTVVVLTSCEIWIVFGAVQVVHFKCSDKHQPSLTLRVALNKNRPLLIWDTLVVRSLPTVSIEGQFGIMNTLISLKLGKARLPLKKP